MNVDVWKFVQGNILLIAVALISGAMLVWPLVRRGTGGPAVSTHEATLMINQQDAVMLDVREPGDYGQGHILNARNIPLSQIEQKLRELEKYKSKPLIVHCETGNRCGAAGAALRRAGFDKVYSLAGGITAWRQAGLPTTKGSGA